MRLPPLTIHLHLHARFGNIFRNSPSKTCFRLRRHSHNFSQLESAFWIFLLFQIRLKNFHFIFFYGFDEKLMFYALGVKIRLDWSKCSGKLIKVFDVRVSMRRGCSPGTDDAVAPSSREILSHG